MPIAGTGVLSRRARLHGRRLHGALLHGARLHGARLRGSWPAGTGLRRRGPKVARARIARQPVPRPAAIRLHLARPVAIRPGIGGRRRYRPRCGLGLGPGPRGVANRSRRDRRNWRRCGHRPPPADGSGPGGRPGRAFAGSRISGSRVPPWPQPSGAAARIGTRVTRHVCGQIAIFAGGWRRFLRLLGRPGLAEVADPVIIRIRLWDRSGSAARVPRLTAAYPATLLRLHCGTDRERSAGMVGAETTVKGGCLTPAGPARTGVLLRVGPPQVLLVPRPSRRHNACYP